MTIDEAMRKQEIAIRNVLRLLKKQGKKIGDLEIGIGAANGYLSRGKYGAKTRISFPTMLMIADYVETPLQDLISGDFAKELELEEIQRQIEELKYLKEKLLREE